MNLLRQRRDEVRQPPNPIINKVSSSKSDLRNTAVDIPCCLELYNGLDYDPSTKLNHPTSCMHSEEYDLAGTGLQDRISTYRRLATGSDYGHWERSVTPSG
ncbi:hypothetical protein ASPCAL08358 [Aspergillus calidoustus]|uniref:Uncharacterized protein n=1 Tax=Aspergillus calidoustus TaxID=454130 RepID=A0A0U5GU68_ASPCI|nr:hypothetical protein ASPCAL08358 [Aspergillus calidoustus]